MNLFQEIERIASLDDTAQFDLFQAIAKAINSKDKSEQENGRNHLIKVIDKWEVVPNQIKPIWEDLIEAAGFYPYIVKYNMSVDDLDARIRQEYHRSDYIPDKTFHRAQKELSELVLSQRNVIVSAPTSFGKSLLIEEIVASGIYKNIVIIQPTLALLDETRIKLKRYSKQYKTIVRTSQEFSSVRGNIFLLTAERVLEYPNMPPIDLLIIDEFYKLSKAREDNRANILNIAFIRLMHNRNCRFYLLGPNIDDVSPGFKEKYDAVFYKSDYSLVYTEMEDRYKNVTRKRGGKVCEDDIFQVLDNLEDQSLIFCSSPSAARKLAFEYCDHLENMGIHENREIPLIQWIQNNLSAEWSLAHCLANGIGVHDGSMPKHITASTIQYFNERRLKFLFCTNTIIEGVNTSAKNVVYYDNAIGNRKVDYFDYSNICGRAGRLMEHCVGTVINLKKPPTREKMVVDIPAYTQNPIDDEVLVNIEKEDIKPFNMERYKKFDELPDELKTILKRNAVSIQDQRDLLDVLKKMMRDPVTRKDIIWSSPHDPDLYNHLVAIFRLVENCFISGKDKNVIISVEWMALQTKNYCKRKSIKQLIDDRITYLAKKFLKENNPQFDESQFSFYGFLLEYPQEAQRMSDSAIELLFKFEKNWLQYKIPKWLSIVDSLQKYVAEELGIHPGDYSFVAESIENEFLDSNIRILTEYGVPSSAIRKILNHAAYKIHDLSEDEVIAFIKNNRQEINYFLSPYEIEALDRCL